MGDLAKQHDSPLINQTAEAELSLKRLNYIPLFLISMLYCHVVLMVLYLRRLLNTRSSDGYVLLYV